MADTWKVVATSVYIRSEPSTNGRKLGSLRNGEEVQADQQQGNWIHHNRGGWSCTASSSGKSYIVRTEVSQDPEQPSPSPPATDSTEESNNIQKENLQEYSEVELDNSTLDVDHVPYNLTSPTENEEYLDNLENSLSVTTCRGILGMPYQFMPIADTRINRGPDAFGRKFADKIVSKMPVLAITPGSPVFLADYNAKQKHSIKEAFVNIATGNAFDNIDKLLGGGQGKFYSLKFENIKYYSYVNTMLRQLAYFMGLENEEVNGVKLKAFNWREDIQADLSKVLNYTDCVAFYIDSEKQVSENFSNDSSQSTILPKLNQLSDYGRELQFLLGNAKSQTGIAFDRFTNQEDVAQNIQNVNDFIDKVLGKDNSNIFKRMTGNIQTIVSGGKLIFPEIWTDSSFGRSYNINQTLISPDPDDLSIYLNIMVPMVHWIGLAAPRMAISNGYISPFLVKAFYKGQFNIDMGIINGLSISKGDEGYWTRSGLPTQVRISADIKDLYSAFYMSNAENGDINIFNNTILMDYLANMCGININDEDVWRNIQMYLSTTTSKVRDSIRYDIFGGIQQYWSNKVNNIYRRMFF